MKAMSSDAHASASSIVKQKLLSELPLFNTYLSRIPGVHVLQKLLVQSGLEILVGRFIGLTLASVAVAYVACKLLAVSDLWSGIAALAISTMPLLYVLKARRKRLAKIEQQLPDAVDLIARALRAGHALPNALKMAGDELPEPIGKEFRLVFDEVNYGITMQDALLGFSSRLPSMDVKYLVIAVLMQRSTGGNVAELLDNVSAIVRARLKLFGTIRVLSAEGRLSAWVLASLPFGTAFMVHLVNPSFIAPLWTDPIGQRAISIMAVLMLVGILWMIRIIRIHV